jgi:peroxiredoxin Q/BCP
MKMLVVLCVMVAVAVATVGVGGAAAQGLEAGDMAPEFSLPGSDGKTHTLADYAGRTVVLAWFPKAFTGG